MSKRERTKLRREMGHDLSERGAFDSMSVLENVMFPLDMFSLDSYKSAGVVRNSAWTASTCSKHRTSTGRNLGRYAETRGHSPRHSMNPQYLFCDEPNSGLDPKTSLVIDELIHGITKEFNTTTVINTHDMNSVMGIGEHILYICNGRNEWQGSKDDIMGSQNEQLNNFIFASDLFRKVKKAEMGGAEERVINLYLYYRVSFPEF